MNRKDLKNLSESYEAIFSKTIKEMLQDETHQAELESPESGLGEVGVASSGEPSSPEAININMGLPTEEDEHKKMTIANLKSLAAHATRVLSAIEGGQEVEAWMNDKITGCANEMLDVWNALEFRA